MEERKIWLDGERFVSCEVKEYFRDNNYEYYTCPKGRVFEVVSAMKNNGMVVVSIDETQICVNRKKMWFQSDLYELNQCSDLIEWFTDSKECEFTYYYNRVVFHHPDGHFYAGYREDINNYIQI